MSRIKSYFDLNIKGFNPYQVLTIHPTELSIFGSHTFHELMIADSARVIPYKKAITQAGKEHPNKIWVDVGAGLCPLSLLAAKTSKPKKIFSVEQVTSTLNLAKKIVAAQTPAIRNKIEFIQGLSFDIDLPEKADILITETIGNFGVEESMFALLNDAKKRFLKKDAITIPAEIEFIIVPIESQRCYQRVNFWKKNQCGLDFSGIVSHAASTVYHHRVLPKELLSKPKKMGAVTLDGPNLIPEKLTLQSSHIVQRTGELHGFVGWFRARLYKNIFLSNDPLKKITPFSWTQAYFPLQNIEKNITKVKRNQKITFSIDWDLAVNKLVWQHYFK